MEALGLIETKGLLAAIESADAMLKAAEVRLLDKTLVGGGLVTITVTGDVAAVKASIDAAAAAVGRLGAALLVSQHVIPRPDQELKAIIVPATPVSEPIEEPEEPEQELEEQETVEEEPEETPLQKLDIEDLHKEDLDQLVNQRGLKEAMALLETVKVVKLRNLAREYDGFGITGRLVSKANKTALIEEFTKYYG